MILFDFVNGSHNNGNVIDKNFVSQFIQKLLVRLHDTDPIWFSDRETSAFIACFEDKHWSFVEQQVKGTNHWPRCKLEHELLKLIHLKSNFDFSLLEKENFHNFIKFLQNQCVSLYKSGF